jgi:hypothetical protein
MLGPCRNGFRDSLRYKMASLRYMNAILRDEVQPQIQDFSFVRLKYTLLYIRRKETAFMKKLHQIK